jgi:DNA-binding transcriptional MerR regulator
MQLTPVITGLNSILPVDVILFLNSVLSMQFETAQVLEITGVSKDTLRHWKRVIPQLRHLDGRSATYSVSELLSVLVITRLTRDLGVTISQVAKSSEWLFKETERRLQAGAPSGVIHLLPDGHAIWLDEVATDVDAAIVLSIAPVLEQVNLLSGAHHDRAGQLAFPFFPAKPAAQSKIRTSRPL